MKQEFEMTQEEMDQIIAINKVGGAPVLTLGKELIMGSSLQEKVNQYWKILGNKYGFKPMTVERSSKGKLFFIAEATSPQPKTQTETEIEIDKYDTLQKIVEQLELCNYENNLGGFLKNNTAFLALKKIANSNNKWILEKRISTLVYFKYKTAAGLVNTATKEDAMIFDTKEDAEAFNSQELNNESYPVILQTEHKHDTLN